MASGQKKKSPKKSPTKTKSQMLKEEGGVSKMADLEAGEGSGDRGLETQQMDM